mgnify:CR=1 FL=1|tara:strand:- start:3685 stop:4665 length:981 start_codon:yes stop_codon:yes gene_type:complete
MIFSDQVESLTGITISASGTHPTNDQLTQYLIDGVLDVTEKWLMNHPQDKELFMNETALQTSQGADVGGGDIISVLRADGVTAGNFRPCRKISPSMQSQVTDTESLSFASKYHPVYMVSGSNIKVFPAPSDNSGKDSYKVVYVNNTPKDGNGTSLTHSDSNLGYFPADKVHLVVIYASIRSLHTAMVNVITDLSSFSTTAVPPNFADSYESTTASVSDGTIEEEISKMQDYIEDNEDVELANAKSAELDVRFKRAMDKFQSGLSKYREESGGYSQEINAEITEEAQKVQTEAARYQWYQDRFTALQAEYLGAFAVPQQAEQQGARR